MKQHCPKKLYSLMLVFLLFFLGLSAQDRFTLRINAGGAEIDYNGETYGSDTYFDTGRTLDRPQTGLPEPFQTFRFGPLQQMSYAIPVSDGEYTVNLYFAELWFGATDGGAGGAGQRVFDINIENQLAEDNLDIFAQVGAEAMLIKSYTVTVTDGKLNIDFDSREEVGGERHPVINGIEILGQVPETNQRPFITVWEASSVTIDAYSGANYNYKVDWGDGTISENVMGDITHTYETTGTHSVSITGDFPRFISSMQRSLKEIKQWGDIQWKSFEGSFSYNYSGIDISATDVPDLRDVISLSEMFGNSNVTNSSGSVSGWDVSSISDMSKMFFRANLDLELSDWDVSNVANMSNMFEGAQFASETGIGRWDVGNVSNMDYMFFYLDNDGDFNEDIGDWDVSSVESMVGMFSGSGFNRSIGNWDVSNVTKMFDMFTSSGLSNESYDSTLIGWSQLPSLQNGVQLDAPQNQYCDAEQARQHIINTYGWTIMDAGKADDCGVVEDFALRINAGGGETVYNAETFVADTYFDTGNKLDRPQTGLPEPYKTFRYGRSQQMGYGIPVPDGEYTVNLYFAELWFGATGGGLPGEGRRVFDVSVEGQLVEDNLDIFAEVGAEAMVIKSHTVTVTDGVLDIDFDSRDAVGGERHPVINAIEILGENTDEIVVEGFTYYRSGGSAPDPIGDLDNGDKIYRTVSEGYDFEGIVAEVSTKVKSFLYEFSGPGGTHVFEGIDGVIFGGVGDEIGVHTLKVTPHSEENLAGLQGNSLTITYEILNHCDAVSVETFNTSSCNLSDGYAILRDQADNLGSYSSDLGEMWVYDEELGAFKASDLAPGTYEVSYDNYGCTVNKSFVIGSHDCPDPDFILRINAGGPETEYNGETFAADTYFDTGNELDRPQTGLPEPYKTFRYSRSRQMGYDIPVPDGDYTVNLYFAELWFGATGGGLSGEGRRVFDVSVEGQLVEDNLDIFAEAGAQAMLIKSHKVTVTDGVLDMDFDSRDAVGGERHPVINAIEIISDGSVAILSVSKKQQVNEMILYPNQVSDFATVSFEKPIDIRQVYIFDITGSIMKSYDSKEIKNGNELAIDVNQYQQGTYIVKMIDSQGAHFEKQMMVKRE